MAVRTERFRIDNDFNVEDLNRFFDRIAQTGGVITNQFQVQLRPGAVDYYVVFEDAVAPTVLRTTPFDGQAFVPALSDIVIIFSEDVVLGTTPFEIFKDAVPVTGFTFVESAGRVDISGAIDATQGNYTVRVLRDEVADTSGNNLLVDFTFAFSTAAGVFAQVAGQIGGTSASPDIRGLRESGATLLTYGAVPDGAVLKRVGATAVGSLSAAIAAMFPLGAVTGVVSATRFAGPTTGDTQSATEADVASPMPLAATARVLTAVNVGTLAAGSIMEVRLRRNAGDVAGALLTFIDTDAAQTVKKVAISQAFAADDLIAGSWTETGGFAPATQIMAMVSFD